MKTAGLNLGVDAGGTRARWALADASGDIVAEGESEGFGALQVHTHEGRERIRAALRDLAAAVQHRGAFTRVHAGVTGLDGAEEALAALLSEALGVARADIGLGTDIEIAYRDLFAPGAGFLVYSGTGSVAAFIDARGGFHRAGGRGSLLDDGGSGYWIALQALRHVWRIEDERPGRWQSSPLASAVFARIGGADWRLTRQLVYEGTRGDLGALALAVAESAGTDPVALAILEAAGLELARLANALATRFGPRPVALSGRASTLHPAIAQAMRAALPDNVAMQQRECHAHRAAARLAATHSMPPTR